MLQVGTGDLLAVDVDSYLRVRRAELTHALVVEADSPLGEELPELRGLLVRDLRLAVEDAVRVVGVELRQAHVGADGDLIVLAGAVRGGLACYAL